MDIVEVLDRTYDQTGRVVAAVTPEQLTRPTPCDEFDVRVLLNHTIGAIKMFGDICAGRETDHSVDHVGDDPAGNYEAAVAAAKAGWREPGVLERDFQLPFGTFSGEFVAGLSFSDALIHGWDLARAIGYDTAQFDPELGGMCLEGLHQRLTPEFRRPGAFGPEIEVEADAPVYDRVAAFSGRQP